MVHPLLRSRRWLSLLVVFLFAAALVYRSRPESLANIRIGDHLPAGLMGPPPKPPGPPRPIYKPSPTYVPPPVQTPFPEMATAGAQPPAIPAWNRPRKDLHAEYGLEMAPPLLIGFTRGWPLLLQTVASYITAGWPPSQIYVVENTGVHLANAQRKLSLQNPFFLDVDVLDRLGVAVIRAPVLMSFAQLQNFFVSVALERGWPWYLWSHADVLVLSYEDGADGLTPRYDRPGYKTVYELCVLELNRTLVTDPRWGARFFAYDHLALVNVAAYEDVGGWDTLIPYYMTDCDMHSRLAMANWTMNEARAGIVTDVSAVLDDFRAFYRDPSVKPSFTDPNPPPPSTMPAEGVDKRKQSSSWLLRLLGGAGESRIVVRRATVADDEEVGRIEEEARRRAGEQERERKATEEKKKSKGDDGKGGAGEKTAEKEEPAEKAAEAGRSSAHADASLAYWDSLRVVSDQMFHYKHGGRGRNTWQLGQRGGSGEPYHYPAEGIAEGIDVLTESGREVFRRKWGHRDCDLITGAGLKIDDQWRVQRDWTD